MYELKPIEYKNERILSTRQIAKGYGTDTAAISNNFNRNKKHYTEDVHYYCLEGEAKRTFLNHHQIDDGSIKATVLYLWTERGALLHAKSLNTDQAWQMYDYLVEHYFRTKEPAKPQFDIPKTLPEALRLAADLAEKVESLEAEKEENKPLVAFAETVRKSKDSLLIREFAKICSKEGISIGEKRLYKKLREWNIIIGDSTEPYQRYIDNEYFEVVELAVENEKGARICTTTRILPRGQIYVANRLRMESEPALAV